jgi:hypothetical protein
MHNLIQGFEDRLQEIETYLNLLETIEKQIQDGIPRLGDTVAISVQQQKILYSSVFLQLYNLIEATVTKCVDAVTKTIMDNGYKPSDLSDEIRKEWVRFSARTHIELNFDNRLTAALELCEHLIQTLPISDFKIEKGQGGSWDDLAIQDLSRRLGLALTIPTYVQTAVKRHFKNDQGSLAYIKTLRNELAHGSLSFVECGEDITVRELGELKDRTALYLREVVNLFQQFIDAYEFLSPQIRTKIKP